MDKTRTLWKRPITIVLILAAVALAAYVLYWEFFTYCCAPPPR